MCDEDIIDRLHKVFPGMKRVRRFDHPKHQPQYSWEVHKAPDVAYILWKILPFLGKRRTARAHEALEHCAKVRGYMFTPYEELQIVSELKLGRRQVDVASKWGTNQSKISKIWGKYAE